MRSPHSYPHIEPLEARIAPAAIVFTPTYFTDVYKNSSGQVELQFINAAHPGSNAANIAIAKTVGENPDVYFIKLSAGDDLRILTAVGYDNLVNVGGGNVVAFFTDFAKNGKVEANDVTGLALGSKVSVAVGAGIHGDVVADYNSVTGSIGDASASAPNASSLLANSIVSLTAAGPITGAVISGGPISRIYATGAVHEILTGTAANGYTFNFEGGNPNTTGKTTLSVMTPAAHVAGPSVQDVIVDAVTYVHLGSGGPGAAGGSLTNITLLDNLDAFKLQAGDGGASGPGGGINNVLVEGPASDAGNAANTLASIIGGAGGNGVGAARGGAGGAVRNVYFDYLTASTTAPSGTLQDDVIVHGGAGGTGGIGGAGGLLNNINVLVGTPAVTAANTFEYQLLGGVGGNSLTGGRGGAGGSVSNSFVENALLPVASTSGSLPDDTVANSPTNTFGLIESGAGGSSAHKGVGGAGGAVTGITLEGFNFDVIAGAGGQGVSAGGAGGAISSVNVLGSAGNIPGDDYHVESLIVTAGAGGSGSAGPGGAGGSLNKLTVQNAGFNGTGLQVTTGAGGSAGRGTGGAGGAIYNIGVTDADFLTASHPLGSTGNVTITTGDGGNATVAGGRGGAGGAMTTVSYIGARLGMANITAGKGGSGGTAHGIGDGGVGGAMSGVSVRASDVNDQIFPSNTTQTIGLLLDSSADFTGNGVVVGDTVENLNTFLTTRVTKVTATELTLASDIFAAGDPYDVIQAGAEGTAQASQKTIVDATAQFVGDGVKVGDKVFDLTDEINGTPYVATVTAVSGTVLTVSADISHVGDEYTIPALLPLLGATHITAGSGGSGSLTGFGGAGGAILNSSAASPGTVSIYGGSGGNGGATGTPGIGGTLNSDGAFSLNGSGLLYAGNAGTVGLRPAVGGAIIGANVQGLLDVAIVAGNGYAGGAGGSISASGFSGVLQDGGGFNPPTGNITVHAGNGGASTRAAGGAGGSIQTLTGFISLGNGGVTPITTQFDAGSGGNGITGGGTGGSVNNIRVFGGGGAGVTFFINAGDAGNATKGRFGATGGSVTNVGGGADASGTGDPNFSIATNTDFHHISAGDGGNATYRGGQGGSVTGVYVNAAIGIATGAEFGFNLSGAGGISAGAGGNAQIHGVAGDVSHISANSIASIIAGHLTTGEALKAANLADQVNGIILNGSQTPSTVQQFNLTYKNGTTVDLPTNATAIEVASALNALKSVAAAGGVSSVVLNPNGSYTVTFKTTGAKATITAAEPAYDANGTTTETVQGNAGTQEVQDVHVEVGPFALSFDGENTVLLPGNATAAQVQTALNALPAIIKGGSVQVTTVAGASNLDYTVTWNNNGYRVHTVDAIYFPYTTELTHGNAATGANEEQRVQDFNSEPFSLTFAEETTGRLPSGATNAQVSTALNKLLTVQEAGGVTVTGTAPNYDITFGVAQAETPIIPNFALSTALKAGTSTTQQVETLTFPVRGDLSPPQFDTSNIVGSIYNILRTDATTFQYTAKVAGSAFQFGDVPIDGLIAASNLTAYKNFVPEAFVTSIDGNALLVDNLNS